MRARGLRYTSLQLAVLGFGVVWVGLASMVLGQRAGGEIGWLPLFATAAALLGWHRLLLREALWQRPAGWAAAFGGALLIILLFMRSVAPEAVARLGSAPGFAGWVRLALTSAPLLIAGLAGIALLGQVLLLLREPVTPWVVARALRVNLLLVVGMLALARGRGQPLSPSLLGIFFGFGMLALALARANELGKLPQGGTLSFSPRWLATLAVGIGGVLLLAIVGGNALTMERLSGVGTVLGWLRYGIVWLFAQALDLLFKLLIPLVRALMELYRDVVFDVLLPWLAEFVDADRGSPDITPLTPLQLRFLGLALLVAVIGVPLYTIYRLYQLFRFLQEEDVAAGEVAPVEAELGVRGWFGRRRGALLDLFRRTFRPEVGIETVRDLYKNLLRFGDMHELARPAEDTPYEYLTPLCRRYPQRAEDFMLLTDAYVAAHYGERTFSRSDIEKLQAAWRRISVAVAAEPGTD